MIGKKPLLIACIYLIHALCRHIMFQMIIITNTSNFREFPLMSKIRQLSCKKPKLDVLKLRASQQRFHWYTFKGFKRNYFFRAAFISNITETGTGLC